ncbi:hypothetical protein HAP48_0042810 [Bradyrhizobium septentrionale]|uniref:Uncharacterized protein n=1 Tax=Bradyrhizobium septentrionale TaxID=1404411 RepID=A0A973W2Y9_9BRAD|nr:hypothetical protein [Bradyrhizobium septentrionale]UGY15190.1 hypothetical protein HAP48_0042810 [Bradyrhizobium septentrionale]
MPKSNCKHFPNADDHCLVCETEQRAAMRSSVYNDERSTFALHAVTAFRDVCPGSRNEDGSPLIEEAVGDLIANLMHLCVKHGVDPLKQIKNGVCHFAVETIEPDGVSHEAQFNYTVYARPYASGESWQLFDWRNPPASRET